MKGYLYTWLVPLVMWACSSDKAHTSEALEAVPGDTLEIAEGDTSQYATPLVERPTEALPREMIGSWQAVELRIGDMILTREDLAGQGIDPPTRYFSPQAYMQLGLPSGELPRIPITYFEGVLHSADQGKEQVLYLGADTLILSADVDGETSTYTYVKLR